MAIEKKKPIELVTDEEDIEIEVDDQESEEISFDPENTVLLDDGSAVVNYEETSTQGGQDDFYKNLADDIDDSSLNEIASDLIESYKEDLESRQDWLDSYTEGLDLLGTSTDDRSEPFRERQESTTHSSQKVQPSSKAKRTKNSSHQEVQSKRGSSVKRRKKSKTKQKG